MGAYLESIAGYLYQIAQFIIDAHNYFLGLFSALKDSLKFVYQVLNQLPAIISSPVFVILGIMIAKFILSLGKQ